MTAPYVPKSEKSRAGDWIQTYTGRKFWPLDPRVGDWDIIDIAHSLSQHPRFGGHALRFYSVAQHSVFVAERLPERLQLEGLLHDGHESIYLDFPRPLKVCFPEYHEAEKLGAITLRQQFHLPIWFERGHSMAPMVKQVDNIALMTERRDLMKDAGHKWGPELERIVPDAAAIQPLSSLEAEAEFLRCFRDRV